MLPKAALRLAGSSLFAKKKKKKKIPGFTNLCLLLKIVCYYLECFQMSVNVYVVNCFAPIICNHCPLHIRMKWGHKIHCPGISSTLWGTLVVLGLLCVTVTTLGLELWTRLYEALLNLIMD